MSRSGSTGHHGVMESVAVVAAPETTLLRGGAATATGHHRRDNEDAFVCGPTWFAVADGMGGQQAGDVASRLAVDLVHRAPPADSVDDVLAIVDRANSHLRDWARRDGATGMGTTLVATTPLADGVAVVSIGDSRCYHLTGGSLTLVTHDHSHVQELVDLGRVAPGDAPGHPLRHIVTRSLGVDAVARPDLWVLRPPVGRLLLCSDGLNAELSSRTIGRVLCGVHDPQAAAERLVGLALRGAARDNLTALVVDSRGGVA